MNDYELRELVRQCSTSISGAAIDRKNGKKNILSSKISDWEELAKKLEKSQLTYYEPIVEKGHQTITEVLAWVKEPGNAPDPDGASVWYLVSQELFEWIDENIPYSNNQPPPTLTPD